MLEDKDSLVMSTTSHGTAGVQEPQHTMYSSMESSVLCPNDKAASTPAKPSPFDYRAPVVRHPRHCSTVVLKNYPCVPDSVCSPSSPRGQSLKNSKELPQLHNKRSRFMRRCFIFLLPGESATTAMGMCDLCRPVFLDCK